MPDYKKMYFRLAAKVADAVDILTRAQQQGENDYIEEDTLTIQLKDSKTAKENGEKV